MFLIAMQKIKLISISLIFLAISCKKDEEAAATTCRNYVTEQSVTSSGNTSTKFYKWISGSLTYSYESGTTDYKYASKNDFVDEGRTLGLFLYTSASSGSTITTRTYNSSKQLTSSVTTGISISVTCTAWDTKNRPTTCQNTSGGCTNANVTYEYNETAGIVKYTKTGGTGSCATSTITYTYDSNFNVISEVGATTQTYVNKATAQECY